MSLTLAYLLQLLTGSAARDDNEPAEVALLTLGGGHLIEILGISGRHLYCIKTFIMDFSNV